MLFRSCEEKEEMEYNDRGCSTAALRKPQSAEFPGAPQAECSPPTSAPLLPAQPQQSVRPGKCSGGFHYCTTAQMHQTTSEPVSKGLLSFRPLQILTSVPAKKKKKKNHEQLCSPFVVFCCLLLGVLLVLGFKLTNEAPEVVLAHR